MNNNIIVCPSCRNEIELTQAMTDQVREQVSAELEAARRKQSEEFTERETQLKRQQEALVLAQTNLEQTVRAKLLSERARLLNDARKEAAGELAVQMQDLQARLAEKDAKLTEAKKAELELRRKAGELEERQQALDLEVARKIDEERKRIREEARQSALESERLKTAEKDAVILGLQQQIEILRQKAEQGSQQIQGEVLELDLETKLRSYFPHDEITAVRTGERGADVLQKVRTSDGAYCGTILWETKRARKWQPAWCGKLRQDQREANADCAILFSEELPEEVRGFGQVDGIWVTNCRCAFGLAAALRQGLVQTAAARRAALGKQDKMELIHRYLSGIEFRQKIEGMVDGFLKLKSGLETERRSLQRIWAKREEEINQLIFTTATLYGDLQGMMGAAALPNIAPLSLEWGAERPPGEANGAGLS